MSDIQTLGVIGAGTMGHGIAQVGAQAGFNVVLVDSSAEALARGLERIGKGYERLVSKERLSSEERDAALARISSGGELDLVAEADLVVEAVVERFDAKASVLAALDGKVLVLFVLAVAAAEAAVGLALFIAIYRNRREIDINRLNLMRW